MIMWLKRKQKRKKIYPMPKWLFWGVIAFVLLLLYYHSLSPTLDEPSPLSKTIGNIKQELPDIEHYKELTPKRTEIVLKNKIDGNGIPVLCGQQVQLQYLAYHAGNAGAEGQVDVNSGNDISPFIRRVITQGDIGSKQSYTFVPPPALNTVIPDVESDEIMDAIDISIEKATPDYSHLFAEDGLKLQLNDKALGQGTVAQCGDEVQVNIRLWDASGKEYFASDHAVPLTFIIGKHQVMLGLEQGIIGMGVNGSRMLVLPPKWQTQAVGDSAFPKPLLHASSSIIIAEITRVK